MHGVHLLCMDAVHFSYTAPSVLTTISSRRPYVLRGSTASKLKVLVGLLQTSGNLLLLFLFSFSSNLPQATVDSLTFFQVRRRGLFLLVGVVLSVDWKLFRTGLWWWKLLASSFFAKLKKARARQTCEAKTPTARCRWLWLFPMPRTCRTSRSLGR